MNKHELANQEIILPTGDYHYINSSLLNLLKEKKCCSNKLFYYFYACCFHFNIDNIMNYISLNENAILGFWGWIRLD